MNYAYMEFRPVTKIVSRYCLYFPPVFSYLYFTSSYVQSLCKNEVSEYLEVLST